MAFEASGFDRERPHTLVTSSLKILRSARKAKAWMCEVRPDAVVGFGGYVSIPVGMAAEQLNVPVVVHEQNSVMGMANKFLARRPLPSRSPMRLLAKTSPTHPSLSSRAIRCVLRCFPLRANRAGKCWAFRKMLRCCSFSAAAGARHINAAISSLKKQLLAIDGLYVVHITGPKEYEATCEELALTDEEASRWTVMPYQDRMAETLRAADCTISRAGATSLAEISALGLPALLVPFPYAAEDHQTTNARAYVERGAGGNDGRSRAR